jgi:hypothetical protein
MDPLDTAAGPDPQVVDFTAAQAAKLTGIEATYQPRTNFDLVITKSKAPAVSEKVRDGAQALSLRGNGNRTWSDYCKGAETFGVGRSTAMAEAKCNKPEGRGYCAAFSKWLRMLASNQAKPNGFI